MNRATRILIVEDDPAIVEVFSRMLCTQGYEVWHASTGNQGLEMARQQLPDLVLLDVRLPDLGGIEVCRQIKADPALLDAFVILVSGEATSTAQKVDGLETGADDYITKPVVMDEFLARIRTIVRLRHTTAALRASERHYRQLVEILPDAISLVDRDGRLIDVNPRTVSMLGYSSPQELLNKTAFDLTPPESHDKVRADLAEALRSGTLRDAEHVALHRDGHRFPIELSAAMAAQGLVVIARDISERKDAEARIRELLHLLDQAHDAILVRDLEGRIHYLNRGAERLMGCKANEIRGRRFNEMFSDDAAIFQKAERKLLETGEWNGDLHLLAEDRRPIVVHSRWTLVRAEAGRSERVVCINTDITRRKEAEAQMHLQSTALEAAANAIVITDCNGKVTWANPAFTQLTGYSAQEVAGRNLNLLKSGRHEESFYRNLWQTILAGHVWRSEMVNRRKDGRLYSEEDIITPVRDEHGQISHFIAVKQDISRRKWSENLLQVQRDFGIFLSTANELKSTVERLLEIVLHGAVDCGTVYLVDQETRSLNLAAHRGLSENFVRQISQLDFMAVADQTGYWRCTEQTGELAGPFRDEGLLAVETIPIRHDGKVVALLRVGSHLHSKIPVEEVQVIEAVAAQAGGAVARIRAEQSLRENRQLLEKTLHSLRAAVFILDADANTIRECNPASTVIFGHAHDEMIGQTFAMLNVDEASRAQFRNHLDAEIKRKGLLSEFEFKMKRKDCTIFPSEHSATPLRDDESRIVGWVSVVRDITEQKHAEGELRNFSRRIIEAQEAERLRVARDLHDGVSQLIASAKMRLHKVEGTVGQTIPVAGEMLARCHDLLVQALEETRRIVQNLRPIDLDELGLAAACRNLCSGIESRTNLVVKCDLSKANHPLPPEVELNLFRVAQEALNNVEKHARAKTVRLRIAHQNGSVMLRIQDDGHGFGAKSLKVGKHKQRGAGLTNMRERAASLGGHCNVVSLPKRGTTVTVRVPCKPSPGDATSKGR